MTCLVLLLQDLHALSRILAANLAALTGVHQKPAAAYLGQQNTSQGGVDRPQPQHSSVSAGQWQWEDEPAERPHSPLAPGLQQSARSLSEAAARSKDIAARISAAVTGPEGLEEVQAL